MQHLWIEAHAFIKLLLFTIIISKENFLPGFLIPINKIISGNKVFSFHLTPKGFT